MKIEAISLYLGGNSMLATTLGLIGCPLEVGLNTVLSTLDGAIPEVERGIMERPGKFCVIEVDSGRLAKWLALEIQPYLGSEYRVKPVNYQVVIYWQPDKAPLPWRRSSRLVGQGIPERIAETIARGTRRKLASSQA